jgi:hypothetical protein
LELGLGLGLGLTWRVRASICASVSTPAAYACITWVGLGVGWGRA